MIDRLEGWLEETAKSVKRKNKPLVSLCWAQSLDGCLAASRNEPTVLSGPASNLLTHRLRAWHDAILVGVGTVISDNPQLTVRLAEGVNPQPIILDSHLRTPPDSNLIHTHPNPAWIVSTPEASISHKESLIFAGAKIVEIPAGVDGRVNLSELLSWLHQEGISRLMVEGGSQVLTSFIRQKLCDGAVITISPIFLAGINVIDSLNFRAGSLKGIPLLDLESQQLDRDIIVWGRFHTMNT